MSDPIDITWATGEACVIVDPELVSYPLEQTVLKNRKKIIERTRIEFTVASVRPATEAEVERWRGQERPAK